MAAEHDGLKSFKLWTKIIMKKKKLCNQTDFALMRVVRESLEMILQIRQRGPGSAAAAALVGVATFSPRISEDGVTFEPCGRGAEHERVLSVVEWRWRTERRPGWRDRWRDGGGRWTEGERE